MPRVHREVEAKYEAGAAFRMPGLLELFASVLDDGAVPPTDGTPWVQGEETKERLRALYFDTAELDLTAAGLTLRRRIGGADAGWQLKVPAADRSRSEVRLPLGRGATRVPTRLVTMTYAVTEGRPLVPVALIDTDRTVRRLVDKGGQVLVEVADDQVKARRVGPSDEPGEAPEEGITWREVEVELVDGSPDLLDAADSVLRARGLTPATSASKLARTLGPVPATGVPPGATGTAAQRSGRKAPKRTSAPAAEIALAQIGTHVDQIRAQDLPVRLQGPGAVHAMRVASRRLRSALKTFEPLFEPTVTRPVREELKWLAGVLGEARDAEVMRDRLNAALDQEHDDALIRPAVTSEVSGELEEAHRAAYEEVLTQLDGVRYRALLDALRTLLDHPPLTDSARRRAGKILPRLVAKSDTRVRFAMKAANKTDDAVTRGERLHHARKAARRARYAAESVAPVFGKDARKFAGAMEEVQDALGDHLESLNSRARLLELASHTQLPSTAFTYGRLHALEDIQAERSESRVDDAWAAARKKRLRTWLG